MRPLFRFIGGIALLAVDGIVQGLSHAQALDFIKHGSPNLYAVIVGAPFSLVLILIAIGFIVAGCIGIWKDRKPPSQAGSLHTEAHAQSSGVAVAGGISAGPGSIVTIGASAPIAPLKSPVTPNSPTWDVRYPGGLADVLILRRGDRYPTRLAIAEDITLINTSVEQASLGVIFLIQYGGMQLAADPVSLPISEWPQVLVGFGIRQKPQVLFPLNLAGRSSVEGHIAFSVRWDGAGRGFGGDVPEKRHYSLEFEELLTKEKRTVSASSVFAPDKNNHQRYFQTDFARPSQQEPLSIG